MPARPTVISEPVAESRHPDEWDDDARSCRTFLFERRDVGDLRFLTVLVGLAFLFYLIPWGPIYVPALAAVAVMTWLRLDLGLVLVVLFAPFFMLPKHFGSKEFYPSEVFLVLDAAVGLLWFVDPKRQLRLDVNRLIRSPFLAPGLLLLVAGGISTLLAIDRHDALRAYRELLLEPAIFFALLAVVQRRFAGWRMLFLGLISAGVLVAAIGLYQFATGHGLSVTPGTSVKRVPSVYGSADNVGLLFDRVLPIWLAITLLYTVTRLRNLGRLARQAGESTADRITRIARLAPGDLGRPGAGFLAIGAVMLATLILTYSRGAWVAIALAALALLVVLFPWGRWLVLACVAAGLLALAVKGPAVAHTLNSGHAGTVHQRVNVWHSSWTMIKHKPIFGIGPDNFLHYYAPTRAQNLWQKECSPGLGYIQPDAGSEPCLSHPHDVFLDFWLSTGILGLVAFLWLQVVFWKICINAYRLGFRPRALVLGVMAAMFASLIHGLVDNSYFLPDLSLIFWLLCGFAAYAYVKSSRDTNTREDASTSSSESP